MRTMPTLLATWSDQADFWYTNALVDAGLSADGASYVGSAEETHPSALLPCRTEKPCSAAGPNVDRSPLAPPAPPMLEHRTGVRGHRRPDRCTSGGQLVGVGTPLAVPDISRDGRA